MTRSFVFACPRCKAPLEASAPDEVTCRADGLHFKNIAGIWRFLLPERLKFFEQFIHDYQAIRKAEGRGAQAPEYYRALPDRDLSGRLIADWRIRSISFRALLKNVFMPAERAGQVLRVLDLGAGNGWLSNRLAQRGHTLAAVDLMTNDFDGLGCCRFYDANFTPVQAEFDLLPFVDEAADVIIFNASLHYSVDIQKTLTEALRLLDSNGKLIVLDSPVYRDASSGVRMIAERENQFRQKFGFPSNALPSQNYLTYQILDDLETKLHLTWQILTPFYGIKWALGPLRALLSKSREPAKFHLIIGQTGDQAALKNNSPGNPKIETSK